MKERQKGGRLTMRQRIRGKGMASESLEAQVVRKVYRTPRLVEYGDLRRLTAGGASTKNDGGGALTKT